jgi:tRNA-2-methylthio-N6-dimethylallyladenosine synthase
MDLIEDIRFDHAYSFLYSKRPGTPAAMLVDNVTQAEKEGRLQRLQARIAEFSRSFNRAMVGSVQRVLVERISTKHASQLAGRADNGRWVNFEAPGANRTRLIGRLLDIEITEALPNSLRGRVATRELPLAS